jgi:HEAT repeat protein
LRLIQRTNGRAASILGSAIRRLAARIEIQKASSIVEAKMGNSAALPLKERIEILKSAPPESRGHAAYSLEHEADPNELPVLADALKVEDPYIRESALYALDWYDKAPIEAAIAAILASDGHAQVREAAAHALASCSRHAAPALIAALSDPAAPVRQQAARALGMLEASEAVAALGGALQKDESLEVRCNAAYALGLIKGDDALPQLIAASRDASPVVREQAADALGRTMEAGALATLCVLLKDPDDEVRAEAAGGLQWITGIGEVRDPAIFGPLCEALGDSSTKVRENAISALGALQDKRAMPFAVEFLTDEESGIRCAALEAIASIDKAGGIGHLVDALGDADMRVRQAAASALEHMEFFSALPAATKQKLFGIVASPDEVNYLVRCSLAKGIAGDPDATPVLIEALQDGNQYVREAAAQAFADKPDKRALQPLLAGLDDAEDVVQAASALALAALGDSAAVEPLGTILRAGVSPYVRRRVVWALSFFDHSDVPDRLHLALQDEDPHVQETAEEALRQLGSCEPRSPHLGTIHYE